VRRLISTRAKLLMVDIAVGLVWALLLAAAVAFSSGISQFIYIDF
jgi:ABC-type cobalamin transport system permease subunit